MNISPAIIDEIKQADPDKLWEPGSVTFAYILDRLIVEKYPVTHHEILQKIEDEIFSVVKASEPERIEDVEHIFRNSPNSSEQVKDFVAMRYFKEYAIEGRVAPKNDYTWQPVMAFWDIKDRTRKAFLQPCLTELKNNNLITRHTIFVINKELYSYEQLIGGATFQQPINAPRPVHMLGAADKKQALLSAGYRGKKTPWNLMPGQKYWSLQGESFREWVTNNA